MSTKKNDMQGIGTTKEKGGLKHTETSSSHEETVMKMSERSDAESFGIALDKGSQLSLIGYAIKQPHVLSFIKNYVQVGWFQEAESRLLYEMCIEFSNLSPNVSPTENDINNIGKIKGKDQLKLNNLKAYYAKAIANTENYDFNAVAELLSTWVQSRIIKIRAGEIQEQYNKSRFADCQTIARQMIDDLQRSTLTLKNKANFSDLASLVRAREMDNQASLTFGIRSMDLKIFERPPENHPPVGESTSLMPGDSTLLLAPTNVGKTTAMITVIKHNLMRGKSVLFLTHEGTQEDIMMKILCSCLGITRQQLHDFSVKEVRKTQKNKFGQDVEVVVPAIDEMYAKQLALIRNNLVYVSLPKAGLTVEEVVGCIRQYQEERILSSADRKGFDLLVDDYPAKLTLTSSRGADSRRHVDEAVYRHFYQLALEYKFHFLGAIQTNREGSKINNRTSQSNTERLLSHEDVLESWGPITEATTVITINRTPKNLLDGTITYYISKSRSGKTGEAVTCNCLPDRYISHGDEVDASNFPGLTTKDGVTTALGERSPLQTQEEAEESINTIMKNQKGYSGAFHAS